MLDALKQESFLAEQWWRLMQQDSPILTPQKYQICCIIWYGIMSTGNIIFVLNLLFKEFCIDFTSVQLYFLFFEQDALTLDWVTFAANSHEFEQPVMGSGDHHYIRP